MKKKDQKNIKNEKDLDLEPTYTTASALELFIIKKLLVYQEMGSKIGLYLSDLKYNDKTNKDILLKLWKMEFVDKSVVFTFNTATNDPKKETFGSIREYGKINEDTLDWIDQQEIPDVNFNYQIIDDQKLLKIMHEHIEEFKSDRVYNNIGEIFGKRNSEVKKDFGETYKILRKKIIKKIKSCKSGYFDFEASKESDILLLLSFEKDGAINIKNLEINPKTKKAVFQIYAKYKLPTKEESPLEQKYSDDENETIKLLYSYKKLECFSDKTIKYKNKILNIPSQIENLLFFFVKKTPEFFASCEDIIDVLKLKTTVKGEQKSAIDRISKLNRFIKKNCGFKERIIINKKKVGWRIIRENEQKVF